MEHVHRMKIRLTEELSSTCEEWLGEELKLKELAYLNALAETVNELHEACEMMYEIEEHDEKHMTDHYNK